MSLPVEAHYYLSSALTALATAALNSAQTRRLARRAVGVARKALARGRKLRREFDDHLALAHDAPEPARLTRRKEGST